MSIISNVTLDGKITDIEIENGKIKRIGENLGTPDIDFGGARIFPGLIDIHSHGAIGLDTMDSEDPLEALSAFQLENGTTSWYPTTMTMSREDIIRATSREIEGRGGANILGFHMEGPFIHPKYKGAQNGDYIMKPSLSLFGECRNIKMVTIAPELPGSKAFIEGCPAVVSIGHTDADYDTALGAMRAGAKCLTHTFNAMNGIHHRMPGPIGAASDTEGVYCQLITDGKHIHEASVRMLTKIMGEDRIIIISDSMRATGLGDGEYEFGGQRITVEAGYARTEGGNLAGSTSTLFECVKKMISFGFSAESAVKMASENPARLMGLNKGKIEVGYDAEFIIVDDDFNLIRAITRGEI